MKKFYFVAGILFLMGPMSSWAQINIAAGGTYTQDFTSLGTTNLTWIDNSTLPGWYISSASPLAINTGSTNTNACFNFGVSGTNPITDRALGAISTATTHRFGLRIKNSGTATIAGLTIAFSGEQWRSFVAGTLIFEYQVGTAISSLTTGAWTPLSALNFTSPQASSGIALDGNAVANKVGISATLTTIFAAGNEIFLRWSKAGTSSPGLAIDDLSIFANGVSLSPEINIQGNSITIADGDISPATMDNTDFGTTCVTTGTITKSFTIQNSGTAPLHLTGLSPFISISGANAADFSITNIPANIVAATNGNTSFNVTFSPGGPGPRTATVSIANDDTDEDPYNFDIRGNGVASAPSMPGAIIQPATIPCSGSTGNTYSIPAVPGATSYTWSVSGAGWAITAGQGTVSVFVTAGTGAGIITVNATNVCGTGSPQSTGSIIPNTTQISGMITGSALVCPAVSETYSIAAVSGVSSYTWTVPTGWSITAGAGTTSITVMAGNTGGNITVSATNPCGTGALQTKTVNVTTVTSPVATSGTFIGNNSFSGNWNAVAGAGGYYVDVYTNAALASDLFISEYVEGSGSNKYIEIFNGTGGSINLANYELRLYSNGSSTASSALSLTGSLANNTTIVYKNGLATIYGGTATANGTVLTFNGNDAIALYKISSNSFVDIIGRIGEDPGTAWITGSFSTLDKTLVRLPSVNGGVTTNPAAGFPTLSTEWTVYNTDDFSHLGGHTFSGGLIYVPGFHDVYTTDVSLDVTGLTPSTNYFYIVRSQSNTCISTGSNIVPVTTATVCSTTATIASFAPVTGPVNSRVTIKGTNFTGTTAVRFGTVNATSFTVINATTIVALVPANTPFDFIKISVGGCTATSSAKFTLITNNSVCGTTGTSGLTEPYISEVYDAVSGGLSYVEIFNPTPTALSLNAYTIRVKAYGSTGGSTTDYPLSGNINSGAVKVLSIGTSATSCSIVTTWSNPTGAGFNGNDQVFVLKSGSIIDRVDNPNYGNGSQPGFSQARKPGAIGPSTIYTTSDWIISTTEDCSNLTVAPYLLAGNLVNITIHPSDINCNSSLTFNAAATSSTGNYNYTWYFNDPNIMSGWQPVSSLPNSPYNYPVTIAGTGSNTITITGSTAVLQNFQFYVEVGSAGSGQCSVTSNAAQYKYDTKIVYRSKNAGNWSTAGNWEMSDDLSTWTTACSYPTALNCDQVIIRNGANITLDIDNAVDKLTIDALATLTATANSELNILNGSYGPDFIINGTYVDGANSANSIGFAAAASWSVSSAATLIKTSNGSAAAYRDNYESGIANIPATANWIYRYTGTVLSFASATTTTPMFYPNLILENMIVGTYASAINNVTPALSDFTITGTNNKVTIKGNLDVGGSGVGNINFANINNNGLVAVTGSLTIKNGSTLINGNASHPGTGFEVKGNIIINGTFNSNANRTGLVKLTGTAATQTISGTGAANLQDLTIASSNGFNVILNKTIEVSGVLTFENNARLNLNSGDVTLKSTANATATVAPVPASVSITYGSGRFNVERYYTADRSWRLITAPLAQTGNIFSNWQNNGTYTIGKGAFVSGANSNPLINGLDDTYYDNYSLKKFINNNYVNVTNTLTTDLSGTGLSGANIGYFMFVRGDRNRNPDNAVFPNTNITTLSSRGKLQTGTQSFDVTNPTVPTPSFSIVGNPYASSIDFNLITKNNVNPHRFYIWDPHINQLGAFVVMEDYQTPGTFLPQTANSTSPQTNFIQSSQSFIVERAVPGTASIIVEESHKSGNYTPLLFRPATPAGNKPASIKTNLLLLQTNGATLLTDGNRAEFRDDFNDTVDTQDAYKFININENIAFKRNGQVLAVERRGSIVADDTLFYNLSKLTSNQYELELIIENMGPFVTVFLEDAFTGVRTPLKINDTNLYKFTVNANAASFAASRFRIVFKIADAGPLPVIFTGISASEKRKNVMVEWTVQNEIDIAGYEVEKSFDGVNFTKVNNTMATGATQAGTAYKWLDLNAQPSSQYYRIRSIDRTGKVQYSSIVMVNINMGANLSIYPNPILNGTISLQFTNMPAGNYRMKLVTSLGETVLSKEVRHNGGTSMQIIRPGLLARGIYQLVITHPHKTIITLQVII